MIDTYLLAAWFAFPVLVWGAMLCVRRRIPAALTVVVCLASIVVGIVIFANHVWAQDAQLLAEVDKFDPDSPEARRALEAWASDTDRSFMLLVSPLLTAVWYGLVFVLLFGIQRVVRQVLQARHASAHAGTDGETAVRRGDDGARSEPPAVG